MSSHPTAPCGRCGIERTVNPERASTGLCRDCQVVERDLVRMHGTPAGYKRHLKARELACDECLRAHSAEMLRLARKRGVPPKPQRRCGTHYGYKKHREAGEDCEPCKAAHAECLREWRARKRATNDLHYTQTEDAA